MARLAYLFISEDTTSLKSKLAEFENMALQWQADGYIDSPLVIEEIVDLKKKDRDMLIGFLDDEAQKSSSRNTDEYRKNIKKILPKMKTSITFRLDSDDDKSSQWTYLLAKYPEALFVNGPLGHEVSVVKDILLDYQKDSDIDLNNPEKSLESDEDSDDEDDLSSDANSSQKLDEINDLLTLINSSPRRLNGFKDFLYKATQDQKAFIENLLRKKINTDKEGQNLLQMEKIAFNYFIANLKKILSAIV